MTRFAHLALAAATLFAVSALASAAGPAADGEVPDAVAALDKHVAEVRFHGNSFADVVDFLRDLSGANVVVRYDELEKVGITKDSTVRHEAKDRKLSAVLSAVLEAAGAKKGAAVVGTVGNAIVLTTPADLKRLTAAAAEHAAALKRLTATAAEHAAAHEPTAMTKPMPELRFNASAASDVFDVLGDNAGVKFKPDWAALKAVGVEPDTPMTARLRNVSTADALLFLLANADDGEHPLDYRVGPDGTVTVSTVAALGKAAAAPPRKGR